MHITRSAPAKINLSLLIGPPGPSGYHEIFTVFVPVDVYDVLSFSVEAKPAGDADGDLHVKAHGIEPEANIVAHALRALERHTGWRLSGRVSIDKGIPLAAGMGGGSTDAATALLVGAQILKQAGGPDVTEPELRKLARGLGADVPFFLDPRPAIGRGIGDLLEPVPLPELPLVLIFTDQPLSTAHVYREFDQAGLPQEAGAFAARSAAAEAEWRKVTTVGDIIGLLQNDLEQTSCNLLPGLCDAKDIIVQEGALGALMSGSGPTIYGVCASLDDAQAICEKVSADGLNCRVARAHSHPLMSEHVGTHGFLQPRID
jgi:4-diphosphocytidyl-2-C-methyl-D-erythritol kinase